MSRIPLTPARAPDAGRLRFALLASGVVVLGLAGYIGYVVYPRFDLPPAAGTALLVLAAGAGVATFFSPCSFPLLLTLLAREAETREGGRLRRLARFAAAFSAGVIAFLAALAVLIGLGGRGLASAVTFVSPTGIAIRLVVGGLLLVLGLVQADVLPATFHWADRAARPVQERLARLRRGHPFLGAVAFGFAYFLIAFG